MGVRRTCKKPTCRRQFTPARGTRRVYCYSCRPEKAPPAPGPTADLEPGPIETATRAALERAERLQCVAGQVALRLARDLDSSALTGSQAASVGERLLKVMETATGGGAAEPDEIDEFTRRAREKRASA